MPIRCHAEYGDYGVTLSRIKSIDEAFAICGFFTDNGARALITEPASPFDCRVFVAEIHRERFDRLAAQAHLELMA